MQALPVRPPYVTFEHRPQEDRTASIEAGHVVLKDVTFAIITPAGSKDRVEREAKDWLDNLSKEARQGRVPLDWVEYFERRLRAWEKGQELPEDGTPIRTWPPLSPAQLKQLERAEVRTVEDLATANTQLLGRIGMGAQALQRMAVNWLQTSQDVGKTAAKLTSLEADNKALAERNAQLQDQVTRLAAAVKELKDAQTT